MDQENLLRRADGLAKALVSREVDPNELKKLVSYFGTYPDKERLLDLLEARWQEAESYRKRQSFGLFIRSKTTYSHLEGLHDLVPKAVSELNDGETHFLLGWAARLMDYYAVEDKLGQPVKRPPQRKLQADPIGGRRAGTVKWFNNSKGYGFIEPDDDGKDVFVHRSATPGKRGLEEDQNVEFATEETPKGLQARDVKLL